MMVALTLAPITAEAQEVVVLAEWTFSQQMLTAERGIGANEGATLARSEGNNITWTTGQGGTSAANGSGWNTGEGGRYWYVVVSTAGFADVRISSAQGGSNTGPRDWQLQFRTDDLDPWLDVPDGQIEAANNWSTGEVNDLPLPVSAAEQPELQIRWLNTSDMAINEGNVAGAGTSRIDYITITGFGDPVPTIELAGLPLAPFSTPLGGPSESQSYTVSGYALQGDVTVSAPAGFEVSLDDTIFSDQVVLTAVAGEVESGAIYVRLVGPDLGAYNGDILHTSPDAFSTSANVQGTVVNPTLQLFVSGDPAAAAPMTVLPNSTWADTGFDNDWSYGEAEVKVYIVPHEGFAFYSAEIVLEWDENMLEYVSASAGNGMFSGSGGVILANQLGDPGAVTLNASRLDGQNFEVNNVGSGEQYLAEVVFNLVNPGATSIDITFSDIRTNEGDGHQGVLPSVGESGNVRVILGDVTAPGDESTADGSVDFEDLVLFAGAYWSGVDGGPENGYKVKYDIGPTANGSVFAMPQVDGQIQFEDLVIFAISYGLSTTGGYGRPGPESLQLLAEAVGFTPEQEVALDVATARVDEALVRVPIMIDGALDLRALSLEFEFDDTELDLIGAEVVRGAVAPVDAIVFAAAKAHGRAGLVDAARMGIESFRGSGELVELVFRPLIAPAASFDGRPGVVALVSAVLRDSYNEPIVSRFGIDDGPDIQQPLEFALEPNYPNPTAGTTRLAFSLPEATHVRLIVFDALGRVVAVVQDGKLGEGRHSLELNTSAFASGTYLYRIEAGAEVATRRLTVLR